MNHLGTKTIETERLLLRKFTIEDAPAMYANWASDPEVTKYLTWQPHRSIEDTRSILSEWVKEYDKADYYQWAIELKGVGPIGSIAVVGIRDNTLEAELGYCIGRAYWGKGIMPEAVKAVIDFLFDEIHFRRITAKHDIENPNSGRVMAKAGMTCEGILYGGGCNNRGIVDIVCYSITAKR